MSVQLDLRFKDHPVTIVGTTDRPAWVATDVCGVLGLKNVTRALASVPPDERGTWTFENITESKAGRRSVVTVTEAGLYRLLFKSRKPEAREFQKWVVNDVLPSIRKHGTYPPPAGLAPVPNSTLTALDAHPVIARMAADLAEVKARLAAVVPPVPPRSRVHAILDDVKALGDIGRRARSGNNRGFVRTVMREAKVSQGLVTTEMKRLGISVDHATGVITLGEPDPNPRRRKPKPEKE